MGAYLSTPHTEIESEIGEGNGLQYAVGSMQGWRKNQEDAHVACTDLSVIKALISDNSCDHTALDVKSLSAFGVFDGHGGKEVSIFVADRILKELHKLESFRSSRLEDSLQEIFHHLDDILLDPDNFSTLQGYRARKNPSDVRRAEDRSAVRAAAPSPRARDDAALSYKNAIVAVPSTSTDASSSASSSSEEKAEITPDDERTVSTDSTKRFLKQILSDRLSSEDLEKALAELEVKPGTKPETETETPAPPTADELESTAKVVVAAVEESVECAVEAASGTEPEPPVSSERARAAGIRTVPVDLVSTDVGGTKSCRLPNIRINAGCTANFALLDHATGRLFVANAGDSRAVLCRDGRAVALSTDHKPTDAAERSRVESAGGFVSAVGRINNNLNLSRSIGDLKYKQVKDRGPHEQLVTAEPDIFCQMLDSEHDEFLVMACDGVWDVMSNQGICEFVRERLTKFDQEGCPSALFDANGRPASEQQKELEPDQVAGADLEGEETCTAASIGPGEVSAVASEDAEAPPAGMYPIKSIVADVFKHCLADNIGSNAVGGDNMTCIIVVFDKFFERIRNQHPSVRLTANAITAEEVAMD